MAQASGNPTTAPSSNQNSGTDKRHFFSKRTSFDTVKPTRLPRPSEFDLFGRPFSTLTKHRIHQLSDIREVSGSSKTATVKKQPSALVDGAKELPSTPHDPDETKSEATSSEYATPTNILQGQTTPPKALGSRATSTLSLPSREVPPRKSSASIFAHSLPGSRQPSLQDLPAWRRPPSSLKSQSIPNRGRAESPVRQAVNRSTQSSEAIRAAPSRTFIRTTPPLDVLERGSVRHDRLQMSVRLPSPLFVGGGTVEGQILLEVDSGKTRKTKIKPIHISKLSIDVIGVEEINNGRRWVFLSLASELFDEIHPPPPSLVTSQLHTSDSELLWQLRPSSAVIPFCINLPLNLGPPPYLSKQASVRYLLCPTVHVRVGDRRGVVRQTWNIQMLTVHDPEKALASLASPLLATDSLIISQAPENQTVKLTAGLHRQTWVNNGMIFVDIHVGNGSARTIKKMEVQLAKMVLWYSHAAAGTAEKSASHLRLPKRCDTEIVSNSIVKKSRDWGGILSHSSEIKTCELEIPRGHVSISTGRYFEVRYFVNVIVTVTMFKSIAVQLPVTIIHMNSLDILPNSLAQVAASIEAKRNRTLPTMIESFLHQPYHQGQAFTAARRQSLDRAHRDPSGIASNDLSILTQDLDHSPRRYSNCHVHSRGRHSVITTRISHENTAPGRPTVASSSHHHNLHHASCCHCPLAFNENGTRPSTALSLPGPKLPRLQVSTSGLGFSESEFEIPPDSPPRKVMLSEQDRKMINQEKELRSQRQWIQKSQNKISIDNKEVQIQEGRANSLFAWKNVAAEPNAEPKQPDFGNFSPGGIEARHGTNIESKVTSGKGKEPARARSKTSRVRGSSVVGPSRHRKGPRSMDRSGRLPLHVHGSGMVAEHRKMSEERGTRAGVDRLS